MAEFHYRSEQDLFPDVIETERLSLHSFKNYNPSIKNMYELYSEIPERATQYVTFESYDSHIEAKEFIEDSIQRFEDGESAGYIICEKDGDNFIGTAGFEPRWKKSIAESGIFLFEDYWGKGYSTERGEAMLELAFEEYDFDYWISKCHPENKASIGAIQNYVVGNGGHRVGVLPNFGKLGSEYEDILYFVLSYEDYKSKS